jgi:hypothetical protein
LWTNRRRAKDCWGVAPAILRAVEPSSARATADSSDAPRNLSRAGQGEHAGKEGKASDKANKVTLGVRTPGQPDRVEDQESRFDQNRRKRFANKAVKGKEPTPALMHACSAQTTAGPERSSRTVDRSMPGKPMFEKECQPTLALTAQTPLARQQPPRRER